MMDEAVVDGTLVIQHTDTCDNDARSNQGLDGTDRIGMADESRHHITDAGRSKQTGETTGLQF